MWKLLKNMQKLSEVWPYSSAYAGDPTDHVNAAFGTFSAWSRF